MSAAEPPARLVGLDVLRRRALDRSQPAIPLLFVRLPQLERTAWREGLRKARTLEKRACSAFAAAAARALRSDDTIGHDAGSDVFVAALTAPTRAATTAEIAVDARSALARISAHLQSATRLTVDAGWTVLLANETTAMHELIERGLQRGAQERERYAFFSALGHELRTPLASIRGYLETLLDDSIDEPTQRRFLSTAYKESLRLSRLVDGMFEISLLDLQPARSARSSGSLAVAVEAAIDACTAGATARAMTLAQPDVPGVLVNIDSDRLTLVLINLIENAIKHGRSGGRLCVAADLPDADFARVTIDDDGPGIRERDRERVFRLGERGETPATGSGIGLALVRLMLERVGGRVDVGDSPLGGARFRICLPRQR